MAKIENNKVAYYSIIISFVFLIFIGSIFIGSNVLFICKISINKLNIIIFPIISLLISKYFLFKDRQAITWKFLILTLVLFYVSIILLGFLNNWIWDYSYDSLSYHQEGVIRLKDGWNPIYDANANVNIWVKHCAKAPWVFAANIYFITGRIESAKLLNSLLPIILFVLSFGFFYLISKKRKVLSILASIIIAFNPVNIAQIFTYYVDSELGIYIIILIITLMLILFYEDLFYFKYFALVNIVTFLVNIKFTGLAYASVILGAFVLCCFIYKNKSYNIKLISFLIVSFIFSVCIIGFNPYITNIINNGNPLYPLAGEGKIDIMTPNTPASFRYDNGVEKLIKSLVAMPTQQNNKGYVAKSIDELLKVQDGTVELYATTDARLRGFGIYSIFIIPLAGILLIYLWISSKNKKLKVCSSILLGCILFAVIYCGEFWWARYVAFLWGIPILIGVFMCQRRHNVEKVIGWGLLMLMLINSLITLPGIMKKRLEWSQGMKNQVINQEVMKIHRDNFTFSFINKANEFNKEYELFD